MLHVHKSRSTSVRHLDLSEFTSLASANSRGLWQCPIDTPYVLHVQHHTYCNGLHRWQTWSVCMSLQAARTRKSSRVRYTGTAALYFDMVQAYCGYTACSVPLSNSCITSCPSCRPSSLCPSSTLLNARGTCAHKASQYTKHGQHKTHETNTRKVYTLTCRWVIANAQAEQASTRNMVSRLHRQQTHTQKYTKRKLYPAGAAQHRYVLTITSMYVAPG